ncbi:hypothetical protein CI610_00207 [invertebrate metagenome]|uniref:Uncharacterized protein n=1 Tax=invertebrate metagenome TaxID=1711999 RepID=A0A2H9TC09_9ZZZZ
MSSGVYRKQSWHTMDAISEFRPEIEEVSRENRTVQEQATSSDQRIKHLSPAVFLSPVLQPPKHLSPVTEEQLSTIRRSFLLNKASFQQAESRSGMSMAFQAIHIKLDSAFEKSGFSLPAVFQSLFKNASPAESILLERAVASIYPVMNRTEQESLPQSAFMIDLYKVGQGYHKWIQKQLALKQGSWELDSSAIRSMSIDRAVSLLTPHKKQERKQEALTKAQSRHPVRTDEAEQHKTSHKKLSELLVKSESDTRRYQSLSRQFLEGQKKLEQQVEQLQTTIRDHEKRKKTDEATIRHLKKEQSGFELINQELETSLSAVSKENARLAEESHHVKQQLGDISEALDISQAREVSLTQKTEQAERDFQQLARQASESSLRQEQSAQEAERLEQVVCQYQERIAGLADTARQLWMSVDSIAEVSSENDVSSYDEIDYIYTVQKKLSQHISELEGNLLKVSEQAQETRVQARDYQQKFSELEQEKVCSDDIFQRDIRGLEQRLAESGHQWAQEREQQKDQVGRLVSSKNAIEQQCRTLKRVIDDRLGYISRLEKNINVLSTELATVRTKSMQGIRD